MKVKVFGKSAEIRAEIVVIAVAALVLLGCLVGYIFFRDVGDIIVEAGSQGADGTSEAGGTTARGTAAGDAAGGADTQERATGDAEAAGDGAGGHGDGLSPSDALSGTAAQDGGTSAGTANSGPDSGKGQIKIYIVGCVKNPGIVTLEKGQMIDDAVRLAGGLTAEADAESINMVYELNENAMLYIKSGKEAEAGAKSTVPANTAVKPASEGANPGKGAELIKDSGGNAALTGGGGGESEGKEAGDKGKTGRVNINTADAAELDTLPGIGEVTAGDIIAFREKNGPFKKPEDIMKVPRIKQSRFDSIKDFITVD